MAKSIICNFPNMISKWNKYIMKKNLTSAGHAEIKNTQYFFLIIFFLYLI